MKTFKPTWNWKSRVMVSISILFLTAFFLASLFLLFHSIQQLNQGIDTDSVAVTLLGSVMMAAAVIWTRGMLDMKDAEYSLKFEDDLMIWRDSSARGSKERTIPIKLISGYGCKGLNTVGFSLLVHASGKTHRLGTLLTLEALDQIIALIDEQTRNMRRNSERPTN